MGDSHICSARPLVITADHLKLPLSYCQVFDGIEKRVTVWIRAGWGYRPAEGEGESAATRGLDRCSEGT
ncbi:hypothetical protein MHPYR_150111 [uncultured Mycobacterium sp.]|uniref:Uncharacterized protein n=1 Tax=uncultured Mycobacterium sp. TaxID=171292 RepID=A0A1Y5P309_9MYCO|nr:hypothetical protein MHPYR_150111 [uncultured Mycobacterium sp.]